MILFAAGREAALAGDLQETLNLWKAAFDREADLRLAIIQKLMLRAVHVPDFSDRHAATHDEVLFRLLRLEVGPMLQVLDEIFPITEPAESLDYGEASTYESEASSAYVIEHEQIFKPIANDYDLIRRIGTGIIHHVGATG